MKVALFFSTRYLLSKKNKHIVNIITVISIVGVAVGCFALTVILSGVNGIQAYIMDNYRGVDGDIAIEHNTGRSFLIADDSIQMIVKNHLISQYSFQLSDKAFIKNELYQKIVGLTGIDTKFNKVTEIEKHIAIGKFKRLKSGSSFALMGNRLCDEMNILSLMSPLEIYTIQYSSRAILNARARVKKEKVILGGIFQNIQEYDNQEVFVPIDFAQKMLNKKGEATKVLLKVLPGNSVQQTIESLSELLPNNFSIKNRLMQRETIYKLFQSEKWFVFLLLAFVFLLSAISIIGSMAMILIGKRRDILTLFSMGYSIGAIRKIFIAQGTLIILSGVFSGILVGYFFAMIQEYTSWITLAGYPFHMKVQWLDLLFIFTTVVLLGLLLIAYPIQIFSKMYYKKLS